MKSLLKTTLTFTAVLGLAIAAAGCTSAPTRQASEASAFDGIDGDEQALVEDDAKAPSSEEPQREELLRAYEDGVRDAYRDFRQKMRATKHFTFDPAKVECGVPMPATVRNGALIPAHEACVQYTPGGWELQESMAVPGGDR